MSTAVASTLHDRLAQAASLALDTLLNILQGKTKDIENPREARLAATQILRLACTQPPQAKRELPKREEPAQPKPESRSSARSARLLATQTLKLCEDLASMNAAPNPAPANHAPAPAQPPPPMPVARISRLQQLINRAGASP